MNQLEGEYLAAYSAACSLAIFVEHIVEGYPLRTGSPLVEDAKAKLRVLSEVTGSDFFTRFERVISKVNRLGIDHD